MAGLDAVNNAKSCLVFVAWTVTSFACHASGKRFLASFRTEESDDDLQRPLLLAGLLTFAQTAACYWLTHVRVSQSHLLVARVTHVLATLATNLSMAFMFASSTFAIKLMEPITSATIQYIWLGTPISPWTMVSLPVIVAGAVGFSGNPFEDTGLSLGTLMAFASNVILAFRNLALKKSHPNKEATVQLRINLAHVLACSVLCLLTYAGLQYSLADQSMTHAVGLCLLASALFHVSYSYVSTGLVLRQLSVVSHAVANIAKRVLVVLLLYVIGQRQAAMSNFLYLGVCVVGLAVYTWDKVQAKIKKEPSDNYTSKQGTLTRLRITRRQLLFLPIFMMFCIMLVQPQSMEKVRRSTNDLYFVAQGGDMVRVETNDQNGAFQTDEVPFCTHCPQAYRRPPDSELEPDLTGYLQPYREEIQAFLQEPLVNNPERAVFLSQLLKTPGEIIRESQRLHFNIIGDVLKKYKAAMLFDIADFENKGDPCITVGEILFLARINLPVVYYCSSLSCTDENMRKARKLAANYSPDELVVLFHGGGNLVGYRFNDFFRFKTMDLFAGYHFLLFPQSIFYNNAQDEHVKLCEREYCCNENLTLVLRDLQTYSFAKEHFKGKTKLLLAPDIAFQIGNVNRFQSPVFDVMWIKRIDYEAPNYGSIPEHPSDVRFHVSDWWSWKTNDAPTSLEKAFYVSVEGFNFLSRGRVLVTDRLHGHILSTLMNMPHVLVDNRYKKLSSYHNSWTKGLENTKLTNQPEKAMAMILDLLDVHQQDLPPRVPFMDLAENFQQRNFEEEEFAKYS